MTRPATASAAPAQEGGLQPCVDAAVHGSRDSPVGGGDLVSNEPTGVALSASARTVAGAMNHAGHAICRAGTDKRSDRQAIHSATSRRSKSTAAAVDANGRDQHGVGDRAGQAEPAGAAGGDDERDPGPGTRRHARPREPLRPPTTTSPAAADTVRSALSSIPARPGRGSAGCTSSKTRSGAATTTARLIASAAKAIAVNAHVRAHAHTSAGGRAGRAGGARSRGPGGAGQSSAPPGGSPKPR